MRYVLQIGFFFIFICFSFKSIAQYVTFYDRSSNGVALSQSTVASPNVYGLYNNMAAISFVDQSIANVNGGMYYGIPELKHFQAGTLLKLTEADRLGITINHFGDPDYRESTVGIGYSRRILDQLGMGFKLNYTISDVTEFGNSTGWCFEGGILGKITDKLWIGYQGKYFFENEIFYNETMIHQVGFHFQPIEVLAFTLSTTYYGGWSIQGGIRYALIEGLWVKIGANSLEPSYSMGLGYQFSEKFSVEGALQYHSILGSSPFLGLIYKFFNQN